MKTQPASCEVIPRIKLIIAKVFPCGPVEPVGSGTQHQTDHRSATAVLCAHRILLDTKLLDGFGRRLNDNRAITEFVVVHSVEQEVVVEDAHSVYRVRSP